MSKIDCSRVAAGQDGGGCEIRTREGLPPTRFPSVRPRPLGESSAGQLTGRRPGHAPGPPAAPGPGPRRPDRGAGTRGTPLSWLETPRTAFIPPTPPGPEGSKGTRALAGVRGVPSRPARMRSMAGEPSSMGPGGPADPARSGEPAAPGGPADPARSGEPAAPAPGPPAAPGDSLAL